MLNETEAVASFHGLVPFFGRLTQGVPGRHEGGSAGLSQVPLSHAGGSGSHDQYPPGQNGAVYVVSIFGPGASTEPTRSPADPPRAR